MTATFTAHAIKRMGQRSIPRWQVNLALQYGQRIYAGGTLFVFVGRRQLRKMERDGYERLDALEGLTLVLDPRSRTVLTCFKNRHFTRKIRFSDRKG